MLLISFWVLESSDSICVLIIFLRHFRVHDSYHLEVIMSIASILDTGLSAASSAAAAAATFTSNLTAVSALAQSSTNG